MQYDVIHGIERNDGASIKVYACPCEQCSNVILQVEVADGRSIRLALSFCDFGHLLREMRALADGMTGPNGDTPASAATNQDDKEMSVVSVPAGAVTPDRRCTELPLEWFVGKYVKIAFQSANSRVEHMWVNVTQVEGDGLVGNLDSRPVSVYHVEYGDRVVLFRTQIEDVLVRSIEGETPDSDVEPPE